MAEQQLDGGIANAGRVVRVGPHVLRASSPHSGSIHAFPRGTEARSISAVARQEFFAAFKDSVDIAWATGRGVGLANPSVHGDEVFAEWVGRYFRLAAAPATARAMLDFCIRDDVRDQLPRVKAPTLVIQRADAVWVTPENGRFVAEHIRGARYLELPGADDWPWLGDAESVLEPTEKFLAGLRA